MSNAEVKVDSVTWQPPSSSSHTPVWPHIPWHLVEPLPVSKSRSGIYQRVSVRGVLLYPNYRSNLFFYSCRIDLALLKTPLTPYGRAKSLNVCLIAAYGRLVALDFDQDDSERELYLHPPERPMTILWTKPSDSISWGHWRRYQVTLDGSKGNRQCSVVFS